jgi:sulfatase-like protein
VRLSRWPLHPLLLTLGWVMAGFVDSGVHPLASLRVLGVAMAIAILLLLIGWAATRSAVRGGLLASATILLLISADLARLAVAAVLIVLATVAVWLARRLTGRPRDAAELNAGLNVLTLVILVLTCVRGIGNGSLPVAGADLTSSSGGVDPSADTGGLPDIHIVLLDAYPRADTLQRLFGFDNSAFITALQQRDFTVATQAHSNYMYTDLTLTAMFQGRHLVDIPELAPLIGAEHQPARLRAALNEAPMLRLLQERGYSVIANATVGEGIALRRTADELLPGTGLNEFERYMLASTVIGSALKVVDPHLPQELWGSWLRDGLDSVSAAASAETDGPKVVFSHVPSPHLPIVVDRNGGPVDPAFGGDFAPPEGAADPAFRAAYLAQLQYLNDQVLRTLDEAAIDDDAMVVILSDHGSESKLDWFNPTNGDLPERFASFFAARTPGLEAFPDDVTPTNLFPILLDQLLNMDLPLTDDRYFVSQGHWVLRTLQEIDNPFTPAADRPIPTASPAR